MVNLIIADAELELIPAEIARSSSARASAGRRNRRAEECLLDSSMHHSAMKGLPDAERRGRPDIVHFCLLIALDSTLNRDGKLKTFVHTRNDDVIELDSSTRLPRNYGRFTGLMEELLLRGKVGPDGRTLARVLKMPLAELVSGLGARSVVFSENGKPDRSLSRLQGVTDVTLIVGGFPHGDFRSDMSKFPHELVSISPTSLMSWTVLSVILSSYHLRPLAP